MADGGEQFRTVGEHEYHSIDVAALLGFDVGPDPLEPDDLWTERAQQDPGDISANEWVVSNSDEFPGVIEEMFQRIDEVQEGAASLLGALAMRQTQPHASAVCDRVKELAEPYRTVVVNHFWLSYTDREIGQALGVSTKTIEFVLNVALDQMGELTSLLGNEHI